MEEERASISSVGLSKSTLPSRLDESSTRCRRLCSPCHVWADEQGVGRMDADSLILRASARTRCSRGSSDKRLSPRRTSSDRAGFLDLQQGKHDVHAYAQRARYLVSNIVTNPIDEATKVVTFMKGLRDGPVKTYLFQEYPSTLEAAITLAMQEVFSLRETKLQANAPRQMPRPAMKPTGGPEPMDLSSATAAASWVDECALFPV
ncbi:unnamed protein product [Phytophthora fragariaefolia]|uniref:Unnamed protein product n=1 Tax=Phytophthora fragariaefolia TaxID=1490495 RepID=A0A9W6XX70_9STRA|nr:unnamed protein product [Phytophthora fragariaefolia]